MARNIAALKAEMDELLRAERQRLKEHAKEEIQEHLLVQQRTHDAELRQQLENQARAIAAAWCE